MNSFIETELIKPYEVEKRKYRKGQLIETSGVFSKYLYYIHVGACKQYRVDNNGKQVIFRLIIGGDFCASAYSLITGKKSFDYIESCEDSVVSLYKYQMISSEFDKNVRVSNLSRKIVEKYFIEEQERAITLTSSSPKERYKRFCSEKNNYLQHFNLGDISSYLGMRRETLSRIRSERF